MALSDSLRQELSGLVERHRVVLFMKGNRRAPQCGFSAQVVRMLDELLPEYETQDVLSSPELRDGIKDFSQWPTIPQLYIDGKFVGGCDIVRDLNASGELQRLVGAEPAAVPVPQIRVSEDAAAAIRAAVSDGDPDVLHLQVSPKLEHDLFFAPRAAGDIEVDTGPIKLYVDRASAKLLDGVAISYVDGPNAGFKIDNPRQPASVVELSVEDAKAMLARGELQLFDVRPESESAIASIAAGRSLAGGGAEYLQGLERSTPIALYCHHGMRSRAAAEQLLSQGFKKVYNLRGGIDAWSVSVDPSVVRY